jgi:GAF domain-containing protein
MSADSNLDRTAFQEFLANAYAVQESQIDSRFLSAFLGVQRLVASRELGIDGVMNLIVNSAQDVAGAAGVAIGLLERDQLIYRAGSGCAASRTGSRVAVSLTVSAKSEPRREILRVENAHTDTRIEGAICRQFGAESLLILPIYRDRMLAGILEIQFSELHAYQDGEVRMYRLMAGLIEEAMRREAQAEQTLPAGSQALRNALVDIPDSAEHSMDGASADGPTTHGSSSDRLIDERPIFSSPRENGIYLRCEAAIAAIKKSPAFKRAGLAPEILVQGATKMIANKPLHSLALSAVIIGLGLTFWMTHGSRGPASPWETSAPSRSSAVSTFQPDVIPVDKTSNVPSVSAPALSIPVNGARLPTRRTRRIRVGNTEVDYIGDDVTVRHFIYPPARERTAGRVAYVGKDVTVRYFAPKPVVSSESR